jgi:hypothetical protein
MFDILRVYADRKTSAIFCAVYWCTVASSNAILKFGWTEAPLDSETALGPTALSSSLAVCI